MLLGLMLPLIPLLLLLRMLLLPQPAQRCRGSRRALHPWPQHRLAPSLGTDPHTAGAAGHLRTQWQQGLSGAAE
jgi:hypothetical protein